MRSFPIIALLLGCLLVVPSCNGDMDPETDDTTGYLKKDYGTVVKKFPDAAGSFFEAKYELSGKVSETDLDALKPVKVTYLFQWVGKDAVTYLASMERDFITGKVSKIDLEGATAPRQYAKFGDFEGLISLEKVLEQVKASSFSPTEASVTLCAPLSNAVLRYYFSEGVSVDARTGEVSGPELM